MRIYDSFHFILSNECLILRFFTLIICILGLYLYTFWWILGGRASWLYRYIMLLFVGESIVHAINLYIAYILYTGRILTTIEHIIYNNRMDVKFLFYIMLLCSSFYKFHRINYKKRGHYE